MAPTIFERLAGFLSFVGITILVREMVPFLSPLNLCQFLDISLTRSHRTKYLDFDPVVFQPQAPLWLKEVIYDLSAQHSPLL